MSSKQLGIIIGTTVILSLILAWVIEQTQIRRFLVEFDQWYEGKFSGKSGE